MSNTLTEVIPKLLAQGLLALRQQSIMPRYVNRAYETMAGDKGSTIDVPIPSAIAVQDVSPGATPPSTADVAPTKVSIAMSNWKEAPFYLTDKDMLEAMAGTIPMQASEAIKALANQVDADIFALYKGVYGFAGTPGSTPLASDLSDFLAGDQALNDQLAPTTPRAFILNARGTANAKGLRAIQDASWRNDPEAMKRSEIGFVLGYDWAMDQNVPRHTAGTAAGATTDTTGYAVGLKTVALASAGTGTLVVGDIITFAGDTQTYVVTSGDTDVSNGGSLSFEPGLKIALAASAVAITVKASHRVNMIFHRDWAALASRPFTGADPFNLGSYMSAVDPVSGLTLRLEVTREHKRTRFSYDMLYGVQLIRREFAARVAGE